jgi:tetratricopeptide (TPR) repeat protein
MNARSIAFLIVAMTLSAGIVIAQEREDALVEYRQGRFSNAVEITLAEIEDDPANLDAYTVLGWSLLALERYEDALEYGLEGLQVSRFDHRIVHIVGEANYRLGNRLEALEFFQDYTALAPTGNQIDEVYYLIGEIHIGLEEYHHADIALTTAVFLSDTQPSWWSRLGYAREMAGSTAYAATAYREALARDPNLLEAQRGLERVQG